MERLTASEAALQASRDTWQTERKRLSNLLTELEMSGQTIQQRHEAELAVLRSDLKKAQGAEHEAKEQLDKACVIHLGRLREVCVM